MFASPSEQPEYARRAEEHYPTERRLSDKKTTCNGVQTGIQVARQTLRIKDILPQGRG
jgi:hypothetical protein